MALINCTECGKEVSSEAKTCPHCGYKKSKKSIWPNILIGTIVVIGLLVASAIYAGHQQSHLAIKAVKERLNTVSGLEVSISKYRDKENNHYVCGMASYRTDGGKPTYKTENDQEEKHVLFIVIEKGFFPSVFVVALSGDMLFDGLYLPTCT